MSTVRLEAVKNAAVERDIALQPASQDIWDKKYRLKTKTGEAVDADIDGTYRAWPGARPGPRPAARRRSNGTSAFRWRCGPGRSPAAGSPPTPAAWPHSPPPGPSTG